MDRAEYDHPACCTACGCQLTFAKWFSEACPETDGLGPVGHVPSRPGALLPLRNDRPDDIEAYYKEEQ